MVFQTLFRDPSGGGQDGLIPQLPAFLNDKPRRTYRRKPLEISPRGQQAAVLFAALTLTALFAVVWPPAVRALLAKFGIFFPSLANGWIAYALYLYFGVFLIGSLLPFLLFLGWRSLPRGRNEMLVPPPFVSLIIPAFNEETSIAKCLAAACALEYPAYEIIVVNDGSTDLTMPIIERHPVTFVQVRRNRGKAAAVNAGLRIAKGNIIAFSDSDSWLHPQALTHLVSRFNDLRITAAAGTVVVARAHSLLTRWQKIEYLFGQFIVKLAQNGSGAPVTICPGPVCAYRREFLEEIGGFTDRTLTEDFDLTLAAIRTGAMVWYEPRAIAYTEPPTRWPALIRQRLRWSRGNFQGLLLYRDLLFARRLGMAGLFWLPYLLIVGYGGAFLEVGLLTSMPMVGFASGYPGAFFLASLLVLPLMLFYRWLQYLSALAASGELKPDLMLSALLMPPYDIALLLVRLRAVIRELRGSETQW